MHKDSLSDYSRKFCWVLSQVWAVWEPIVNVVYCSWSKGISFAEFCFNFLHVVTVLIISLSGCHNWLENCVQKLICKLPSWTVLENWAQTAVKYVESLYVPKVVHQCSKRLFHVWLLWRNAFWESWSWFKFWWWTFKFTKSCRQHKTGMFMLHSNNNKKGMLSQGTTTRCGTLVQKVSTIRQCTT